MASLGENISQGTNWLSENIFNPIGSMFGLNNLRHEFGYNPEDAQWDVNKHSESAMEDLSLLGGVMQTQSKDRLQEGAEMSDWGKKMMSGTGDWYDNQQAIIAGGIKDAEEMEAERMERLYASRGIGGGGIRDVLTSSSALNSGEKINAANLNLLNTGMQFGQQSIGIGNAMKQQSDNLLNMASGAYQAEGAIAGQINSLEAETAMFNADQANREKEFAQTSAYNQAAGNRDNKAGFWNNVMKTVGAALSS